MSVLTKITVQIGLNCESISTLADSIIGYGFEIPCMYSLYGPKPCIEKLKGLSNDLVGSQRIGQCA